ncbi:Cys-tRNA(Pro) deacylase [Lysinibacillus sp. FSL M8-0216]|uniref:Cys-tRNA(Pro)/Cys-tRNA(Cys) deacylase n=1 Tax=Lysinibacillus fusiformis TaxID=28031 RepID=A0A1H9HIH0_9BACI|nr:Cys-tRNA(Pro) deacylase [Lysinibacillus fusiformis]PCD83193.1 Cys-tRNA(Pro) deacylase [Lysinibacillus fusiformis]SCX55091.1 Cys-tRNA(Pro)/Cys-tRNA(Cys) deacylase [Lysinibacillus fusiformis]SCY31606.1 Cys-tRNA(Pro)/Cys-tRNA(Cys) deacylase [Lysinibacillus fusiformis]SDB29576.1 Cys-tRNA(Pro)/Cys-tRNA(Cys) deacylase [Lysinibacillus fusiformis]SEN50870.1 Cys-tRNA(Pro)/Cys-tRNA(Cys) deacylase [Lysinibacillus fusiformis]
MAKAKHAKTNAIRLLEQQKIQFDVIEYEIGDGQVDGVSVAEKIGQPVARVFKTLVARASAHKLFVFVIPVADELDLKAAAKVVGEKKIDMLPVKDLLSYTGYVRGGCSPVGMKKLYPTVIDETAQQQGSIIVSAGKIGMQMHVQLNDLKNITKAQLAPITTTH